MESLDILIYAAITAFLAYRLWSVLGQKDEGDGSGASRPNPFARADKPPSEESPVVLEGQARPMPPSALTPAGHAPASLAGALDQVKAIDPAFDEKKFLEGARVAFSRIVAAFAAGDMTPVQRFLGRSVLDPFEEAIRQRKAEGQSLENRIERFAAVDIVGAQTQGSLSTMTVEFVTHQVNVLRDAGGQVMGGIVGKAEEVRDIWVFRRDMKSADPNWQLIETRS
ncbi:MAG: Tim44/TimA family putative adaptor protein [Bdellovibrionales bacterium]|jgi:predicted lipid-binding transport protein (Tim44 family)